MTDQTKNEKIKQFNNTVKTQPIVDPSNKSTKETIAEKALDTDEQKKADKLQKELEAEAARKLAEKNATILQTVTTGANTANQTLTDAVQKPRSFIENLPTPGGIASLIIILLFFTFAVIPVNQNGDTRLKLLWLTLIGRTNLVAYDNGAKSKNGKIPASRGKMIESLPTPSKQVEDTPVLPTIYTIELPANFDFFGSMGMNFE